jgi:hypothetical protein
MAETSKKIKRSGASLQGGFIVALAVITLTYLIGRDLCWQESVRWMVGIVIGGAMGAWVRIADL